MKQQLIPNAERAAVVMSDRIVRMILRARYFLAGLLIGTLLLVPLFVG